MTNAKKLARLESIERKKYEKYYKLKLATKKAYTEWYDAYLKVEGFKLALAIDTEVVRKLVESEKEE